MTDKRLTREERDIEALAAYRSGEDPRRFGRRLYYITPELAIIGAMRAAESSGLIWADVKAERDHTTDDDGTPPGGKAA